ncbi:lantibiotic dehydratase [Kineosporia babensis]|uniref:Lantibiotic dehydratase n=1 Tax=Kineosporia babensis TaxID=499548 RepID=A0A9X1NMP6_9ACTN|nr:lantibiotic dehydratase [Kineosporia babensis]MCD5315951.1 lantibiotic dehydratase [Kineosporia babensis]
MRVRYRPLSRVMVRAPLLPATVFPATGGSARRWLRESTFRFAVAAASPDLSAVENPDARARAALQRYLIRASTRPTPFGTFAAIGLAPWSSRTDLQVTQRERPSRTRPDLAWLTGLAQKLADEPLLQNELRLYANTCVLQRADRCYLSDPGTGGAAGRPDVSVRATAAVRQALTLARTPIRRADLIRLLSESFTQVTADRVERLVQDLVEQRFLLPEIVPGLAGDPLDAIRAALRSLSPDWEARLSGLATACRAVDPAIPASLADLRRLLPTLQAGPADVQVDSALPLSGGITRRLADDATQAAELLLRLDPDQHDDPLSGYRSAFHTRYGRRCVPLLELLDPRTGLGAPGGSHNHRSTHTQVLTDLAAAAIRTGRTEVELTDDLLDQLAPEPASERLPVSLELSLFVAAADREALDRGDYLLSIGPNLGGQAAGRGLGRFADLLGSEAVDLLTEAACAEQALQPDAVVAELVYRPVRERSANVAVRPVVREYEIPVGVPASLPPERVLHVDELSVALVGGRFQLWSQRLQRPVVPAWNHMLNPSAASPLGRALMDLAEDSAAPLNPFSWGAASALPFLPRVRRGRIVLAPARWRLDASVARSPQRFAAWRREWQVPRLVQLSSGDNRLLLDLDEPEHLQHLSGTSLYLQEALPSPDQAWLPGPDGPHLVELVVPMVRTTAVARPGLPVRPSWNEEDRRRPPGSDWLYLTLSGPGHTENDVLTGPLLDLLQQLPTDGWFFVRYSDPDRHLRLRLHGNPQLLMNLALPQLTTCAASLIASGRRTRFGLETYERELERYGGPDTTTLCERIACADSLAVTALLPHTGPRSEHLTEIALLSCADLLGSLLDDELPAVPSAGPAGGDEFRKRKGELRTLVACLRSGAWDPIGAAWETLGPSVAEVLAQRRSAIASWTAQLRAHCADGTSSTGLNDLADSILHLHANRLGLDRAGEQRVRGLLDRTLRSLRAFPAQVHSAAGGPG